MSIFIIYRMKCCNHIYNVEFGITKCWKRWNQNVEPSSPVGIFTDGAHRAMACGHSTGGGARRRASAACRYRQWHKSIGATARQGSTESRNDNAHEGAFESRSGGTGGAAGWGARGPRAAAQGRHQRRLMSTTAMPTTGAEKEMKQER